MREILFRGKTESGIWVIGGFHKHETIQPLKPEETKHLIIVDSMADWNMPKNIHCVEVIPETVGQFTGFTDKSGTKIFEGDIVRYGDTIHEVVFEQRNGTAYFGLVYSESETLPFGHYQDLRQIEVIGNIYDTPELLKGAMKPAATDVAQSGLAPATENFSLQEA